MALTYDPPGPAVSGALSRLAGLGYDEAGVCRRLALDDLDDLQLRATPIYRQERLQERDPLATAIDLLLLQGAVPEAELDRLFPAPEQKALAAAGILRRSGGAVRALASLYPVGRRLIFSDLAWPQMNQTGYSSVPFDQVMGIGTDSRWLARATLRRPVGSALDLCCGSGVHALLAAGHADRVTAVDCNPRAVRCTAFNAKALGLTHLQALQGDLYGPVAGRRFDLITCNPPFVPAPTQEVGYRDGGRSGEDIQRRVVAGLPRHLAPGGTAQMVTELGEGDGAPLEDRLRAWLGGAAMALHVLRLRTIPAQAYAIGHGDGDAYADFLASVGRWSGNLRDQGYRRVVSVLLAFQWSADPWTRVDQAHPPRRDAGPELEALWDAQGQARDPALDDRLRAGQVARTGPVALLESRALGAPAPATAQARLAGLAMPIDHPLTALERDLLCSLEHPTAGADLLTAAAGAGVPERPVLDALAGLVGKGLIRLRPSPAR